MNYKRELNVMVVDHWYLDHSEKRLEKGESINILEAHANKYPNCKRIPKPPLKQRCECIVQASNYVIGKEAMCSGCNHFLQRHRQEGTCRVGENGYLHGIPIPCREMIEVPR